MKALPGSARLMVIAALSLLALLVPATASASLDADPPSYDWGNVDRYQQSSQQTFVFTNNDPGPLGLFTSLSGDDAGQFSITNDGCDQQVLQVGDSCSISVVVSPQSTGALSASLDVDDGFDSAGVPLSATSTTGTLAANPDPIAFSPQPWFFGSQYTNVNVQAQTYGVSVSSVGIAGPDQALFSINNSNCAGLLNAFGTCSINVAFNPTGPSGPAAANLVLTSDGQGSPQSIPITAEALTGPLPQLSPAAKDFGPVAVGSSSATQTFTMTNAGDYPAQVQQILVVSGVPQSFPKTNDGCTLQIVVPGDDCTFDIAFSPGTVGSKEASIFLIGNGPSPVTQIGLSGQGLNPPDAAAVIDGTPAVGETLDCTPVNANGELSYGWLRDGDVVGGADGPSYDLSEQDLGARMSCRITATNPLGSEVATSPETEPVAPRDLRTQPLSLVAESNCRLVDVDPIAGVDVSGTEPATPESQLTFSAKRSIDVQLGSLEKSGKRVRFTPRQLSGLADGVVPLTVDGDSSQAVLAPCTLSGRVVGSKKSGTTYALSGSTGVLSGKLRTPNLSIRQKGRFTADVTVFSYGSPELRFPIGAGTTRYNGVRVELSRHGIEVSGLPDETNTVQIDFDRGVVRGRKGKAKATASLQGQGKAQASFSTAWR